MLCRKGRLEKEYSKAHQFLFPLPDCRMMNGRSPPPCRGGPIRRSTARIRVPRRRLQPQGLPAARYPLISTRVSEFHISINVSLRAGPREIWRALLMVAAVAEKGEEVCRPSLPNVHGQPRKVHRDQQISLWIPSRGKPPAITEKLLVTIALLSRQRRTTRSCGTLKPQTLN